MTLVVLGRELPRKDTCNFILGIARSDTKMVWFIENYPESAERSEVFFE